MPAEPDQALEVKQNESSVEKQLNYSGSRFPGKEKEDKIKSEISVFLVDDDKIFLTALNNFLSNSLSVKFKFKIFLTAEECLAETRKKKPDIIVLDYILSSGSAKKINGLSALKQINVISPETYVIMLSAQDDVDVALDIINEGAYDYISKNKTAFLRLKKMIQNLGETISQNRAQDRQELITKRINMFIIILLLVLFIISRIIH